MRILSVIIFFCFFSFASFAQTKYSTKSKKAIKRFEEAKQLFSKSNSSEALELTQLAIESDDNFVEAYLLMAEIFVYDNKLDKAISAYNQSLKINPEFHPIIYFTKGKIELRTGKYKEAKSSLTKFSTYEKYKNKFANKLSQKLEQCDFAINAIENPVPFVPVNLGDSINSEYREYFPGITADSKVLLFTRLIPNQNYDGLNTKYQEDLYISENIDGHWSKARNMGTPVNTFGNEGVQAISADGQIIVFTSCLCRDGRNRCCDIYYSRKLKNRWSKPQNIGFTVNSSSWESQPALSADGSDIYFVSSREGGKGNKDLWKSSINDNGIWSKPVNLGDSINTKGNDTSPFVHPDNQTLYYTSDGLLGMGGFDIYMSRRNADGSWGKPVNIGYPINTHNNEQKLIVNAQGNLAMFSSDRFDGFGLHDLYEFELAEKYRPQKTNYIKGVISDAETEKRLFAKFELSELDSAKTIAEAYSNQFSGEFLVCLSINDEYALNVVKQGYMFYSRNFSLEELHKDSSEFKPYIIEIALKPIRIGNTSILKNIFFDTDSYNLKPISRAELNKLVKFLKINPTIKIELSGHTDSIGSREHNEKLSLNRAKSVSEYLISHSVAKNRLTYKGYGFSHPVADNKTVEGRATNRRTEFKVTGILER